MWHDGPHGYHAWSTDGGASFSSNAKAGVHLYEAAVEHGGGASETFRRRERPGLLFDAASGWPTHLLTGVQRCGAGVRASDCSKKTGGTAYSHVQQLGSGGGAD